MLNSNSCTSLSYKVSRLCLSSTTNLLARRVVSYPVMMECEILVVEDTAVDERWCRQRGNKRRRRCLSLRQCARPLSSSRMITLVTYAFLLALSWRDERGKRWLQTSVWAFSVVPSHSSSKKSLPASAPSFSPSPIPFRSGRATIKTYHSIQTRNNNHIMNSCNGDDFERARSSRTPNLELVTKTGFHLSSTAAIVAGFLSMTLLAPQSSQATDMVIRAQTSSSFDADTGGRSQYGYVSKISSSHPSFATAMAAKLERSPSTQSTAHSTSTTTPSTAAASSSSTSLSSLPKGFRYWTIMEQGSAQEKIAANTALMDFAVGSINSIYYDPSGGAIFEPHEFYNGWKQWLRSSSRTDGRTYHSGHLRTVSDKTTMTTNQNDLLSSRQGAVEGLQWLVSQLHDPYSKYLTREELRRELYDSNGGFLGTGAMVEAPRSMDESATAASSFLTYTTSGSRYGTSSLLAQTRFPVPTTAAQPIMIANLNPSLFPTTGFLPKKGADYLPVQSAMSLPVVTAVAPNSPAERAGITVGDRIVSVRIGPDSSKSLYASSTFFDSFLNKSPAYVAARVARYASADNYVGYPDIAIAKPVYAQRLARTSPPVAQLASAPNIDPFTGDDSYSNDNIGFDGESDVVVAYRSTRVRLPTSLTAEPSSRESRTSDRVVGGDSIVYYELLKNRDTIFDRSVDGLRERAPVGYIRLTRFSKASTDRYIQAIRVLEEAGAKSFIFDLRNNYGGIIQEAMLTASTLLRDPHAVLCYTLNSRGGMYPHEVEEYVVNSRYPGYFLGNEPTNAVLQEVKREHPEVQEEDGIMWLPPSSYASLHEQNLRRGLHRASYSEANLEFNRNFFPLRRVQEKSVVVLVNEGTASSAEVFASALRDNGRAIALVGTKTYGKGLIQHNFDMPDGGVLRLTIAEYLTPKLRHVTHVGGAQFDPRTGDRVGGGIYPDIPCNSNQGIPAYPGADLCVGMALDALDQAEISQ